MDIHVLLTYSEGCRVLLRETLRSYPDALTATFATRGEYKSIRELLAHMIGAEERWVQQRLEAGPRPSRYEERAALDLDGLYADWDGFRRRLVGYVETHAPLPARQITFSLPQWGHDTDTLSDEAIVFHLLNHQQWHLGQISLLLQQQDIDPPNFDFPLLHPRKDS